MFQFYCSGSGYLFGSEVFLGSRRVSRFQTKYNAKSVNLQMFEGRYQPTVLPKSYLSHNKLQLSDQQIN